MNEGISKLLPLEEIIVKYPNEELHSEVKDPVTKVMRPVFSRVYRNQEGKIIYVEPYSIRWNDQTPPGS